jgi:hypothetical protein
MAAAYSHRRLLRLAVTEAEPGGKAADEIKIVC